MAGIGLMFAGQGSQYVGMGEEMARHYPEARRVFDLADEVLGYSLSRLCFEGPKEELVRTEVQQPAVLAVSLACYEALAPRFPGHLSSAGLSLGEYGALTTSGVFEVEQALPLVRTRGRLMQETVAAGVGGMAAIMGLGRETVEELCRQARGQGVVEPANYNSPGQVVVAGEKAAVASFLELAQEAGAKRTRWLPVSAPFHTSLLEPAAEQLAEVLAGMEMSPAHPAVISNVDAETVSAPEEIRRALAQQVCHPVQWEGCVQRLHREGAGVLVEIGPGKTLSGFARRTIRGATILNVEDPDSLRATLEQLEGVG